MVDPIVDLDAVESHIFKGTEADQCCFCGRNLKNKLCHLVITKTSEENSEIRGKLPEGYRPEADLVRCYNIDDDSWKVCKLLTALRLEAKKQAFRFTKKGFESIAKQLEGML